MGQGVRLADERRKHEGRWIVSVRVLGQNIDSSQLTYPRKVLVKIPEFTIRLPLENIFREWDTGCCRVGHAEDRAWGVRVQGLIRWKGTLKGDVTTSLPLETIFRVLGTGPCRA